MIKKTSRIHVLPALNACLIVSMGIYFYGGVPDSMFIIITVFFAFAGNLKDMIVKWFTREVSVRVHGLVFFVLICVWAFVLFNKEPKLKE